MRFLDRVQETTATTGTGTITLGGAVTGFRSFSSVLSANDRVPYTISGGSEWETGEGLYVSGTLSRLNIFASSNAGALVNFSAGSKGVWIDIPAFMVGWGIEMMAFARGFPQ